MRVHHIGKSTLNRKSCGAHSHDAWELILNMSGKGISMVGDQKIPFESGTITLCPPGVFHSKQAYEPCFEDIFVTFSDSRLPGLLNGLVYLDDSDDKIKTLLHMMMTVFYAKDPGWQGICDALMETVMQILLSGSRTKLPDNKAKALQSQLIQHFHNPDFTVEQAMNAQPYCRDYLCRCFKKAFGVTPVKYLNQLRLSSAKERLRHRKRSGLSVSEIAYLSGFYDSQYFSRLYHREMGIAPTEEPEEEQLL
ncbi:MAG: AraC family transcriptional regulator [Massiliimalia sp.]